MKRESYPRLTLDHNYHVDCWFFGPQHRTGMLEPNLPLKTLGDLDTSENGRGELKSHVQVEERSPRLFGWFQLAAQGDSSRCPRRWRGMA
jgi:hypothetical protein